MAQSKAHIDAVTRYNKSNYRSIQFRCKPEQAEALKQAAAAAGQSMAGYILQRCLPGETNDQDD